MTKLLVNITKIERNIKYINNAIKDFKYKIGVAKGNGYGHDSRIIIPLLVKNGCNVIALARMDECIECYEILKQLKKEKQIIIFCLGIVDDEEVKSALKYGITIPVSNIDQAKRYAKMNIKNLKVHWKLNTGMNRIGFKNKNELLESYKILNKCGIINFGVFSHIFDNENLAKMKMQFEKFEELLKIIPNWKKIPIISLRASGGILAYIKKLIPKKDWETGARYGEWILSDYDKDCFNTFQLVSNIIQINKITTGENVGYDSKYTAVKKEEFAALIPLGWGDGFNRAFKGGKLLINGKYCPIIGKISMDSMAVAVDKNAKVGDKVYIFKDLEHATTYLEDKSDIANIIAALCAFTKRIPRVAVKKF